MIPTSWFWLGSVVLTFVSFLVVCCGGLCHLWEEDRSCLTGSPLLALIRLVALVPTSARRAQIAALWVKKTRWRVPERPRWICCFFQRYFVRNAGFVPILFFGMLFLYVFYLSFFLFFAFCLGKMQCFLGSSKRFVFLCKNLCKVTLEYPVHAPWQQVFFSPRLCFTPPNPPFETKCIIYRTTCFVHHPPNNIILVCNPQRTSLTPPPPRTLSLKPNASSTEQHVLFIIHQTTSSWFAIHNERH